MYPVGKSGVLFLVAVFVGSNTCLIVATRAGLVCIVVIKFIGCGARDVFRILRCFFSSSSGQKRRRCSGVCCDSHTCRSVGGLTWYSRQVRVCVGVSTSHLVDCGGHSAAHCLFEWATDVCCWCSFVAPSMIASGPLLFQRCEGFFIGFLLQIYD